jgi:hypothetical protein
MPHKIKLLASALALVSLSSTVLAATDKTTIGGLTYQLVKGDQSNLAGKWSWISQTARPAGGDAFDMVFFTLGGEFIAQLHFPRSVKMRHGRLGQACRAARHGVAEEILSGLERTVAERGLNSIGAVTGGRARALSGA